MEKTKKNSLLFVLGAAFEYYDFIIYGLMSNYIAALFFPNDAPLVGQLKAFSIFALGYVARPAGALIWGAIGDVKGRREAFIKSNIFLGLTMIGISILPDYSQLGVFATILLIILRVVQAVSFAAEIPGASILLKEQGQNYFKRFSFVISGSALGAILASSFMYILENNFTNEQILNYAWRLPFIFGTILFIIGIYMRKNISFVKEDNAENKTKLFTMVFSQVNQVIPLVLIIAVPAYLIVMNVFFTGYIPNFYGYKSTQVFSAMTISLMWSAIFAPTCSYIFDLKNLTTEKILGYVRSIIFAAMILGFVINFLLLRGENWHLVTALCLYQSINTSLMVLIFPLMNEVFPKQARFTLVAFTYNITYLLISFVPVFVGKISGSLKSPLPAWLVLLVICLFALSNMNRLLEEKD